MSVAVPCLRSRCHRYAGAAVSGVHRRDDESGRRQPRHGEGGLDDSTGRLHEGAAGGPIRQSARRHR